MKPSLIFLLLIEILIAFLLTAPGLFDRKQERYTYALWLQKKTPEARREFETERRISEWYQVGIFAVSFVVMAVPTIFIRRARARRSRFAS